LKPLFDGEKAQKAPPWRRDCTVY